MTPTGGRASKMWKDDCKMQSAIYRESPTTFLGSMALVAIGSFVAGFGGYLIFGLIS
jgi:hypothetical protein